jgi:hypothetical protein
MPIMCTIKSFMLSFVLIYLKPMPVEMEAPSSSAALADFLSWWDGTTEVCVKEVRRCSAITCWLLSLAASSSWVDSNYVGSL